MFTNDLTLAGTSTSKTYSLISVADQKSVRRDSTTTLGNPREMVISHQTAKGPNGEAVDRHMVRLDLTKTSSLGQAHTGSAYVVLVAPRAEITEGEILDMVDQLKAFLTAGNVDKVLNGEP